MKKKWNICVIKGDGVGIELIDEALRLIENSKINIAITHASAGFGAYEKYGTPLPRETIDVCKKSDAILFGAVTTPPHIEGYFSPIVRLRKLLQLYANIRPIFSLPIKNTAKNVDLLIVRENTQGLYSGIERKIADGFCAERIITKTASLNILSHAFALAKTRRKKVTVVHKANVLRLTDGLFLDCAKQIAQENNDIEWNDMLVDSCAMQLIKNPQIFDVIVTTNMFGDILSDEAAALVGGLGIAASANIGKKNALFEPVHGSAPKYTGKNKVNPLATFFAVGMMFAYLGEYALARNLKKYITHSIKQKVTTYDLGGSATTSQVSDYIIDQCAI